MYRDAITSLDERDRAVGAILIGEALIASCERARVIGQTDSPEAWRAIRDAHDDFPEIWRSLDQARQVLARRGINVIGYDELRPRVRTRLATGSDDSVAAMRVDPAALDDARRATDQLKLAVPGADWAAIEQRTTGLVQAALVRRWRNRLLLAGVVVASAMIALSFFSTLAHRARPDPGAAMRREIAAIAEQRRYKIADLQRTLGERCDPPIAHELTRQLVMDGRSAEARSFGAGYTARCGEDVAVIRWANAPLP